MSVCSVIDSCHCTVSVLSFAYVGGCCGMLASFCMFSLSSPVNLPLVCVHHRSLVTAT